MKKVTVFLILGCLIASLVAPIAADDDLPPVEIEPYKDNENADDPGNLVRPEDGATGDVWILENPDKPIYDEDNYKGFQGEPLIAPNPNNMETIGLVDAPLFAAYNMIFEILQMFLAPFGDLVNFSFVF